MTIKRALISVSDKAGIVEFARGLAKLGIEIISTGGTQKLLEESGISVKSVSEITGFDEMLEGRVKTLHPAVHAGILADRASSQHMESLKEHNFESLDLVVVNLYPFEKVTANAAASFIEATENIDIGGPTMLRAAAKNHLFVTALVDKADYEGVLREIQENGDTQLDTRKRLALKVFEHTSAYDALISTYMATKLCDQPFPKKYSVMFEKVRDLRYGENPHQKAAFYKKVNSEQGMAALKQLHGKELSYNNIQDANSALLLLKEFEEPAAVVIKHMNPCGVASSETILEAFKKAYDSDPISIFGGIVALNRTVDEELAKLMSSIFLEIVMAPNFSPEALEILRRKKNLRLLKNPLVERFSKEHVVSSIEGGLLVQERDCYSLTKEDLQVVTQKLPSEEALKELLFAWKVVKHVKSNAIILTRDHQTVGVGAGQMNRVGAALIAINQAGEKARGAVLASDAFFPMSDTVEMAAKAGIQAIIQTGGSIKDHESIAAADKHNIAMILTGIRHFKH